MPIEIASRFAREKAIEGEKQMGGSRFGRSALLNCAAIALLAGCGGEASGAAVPTSNVSQNAMTLSSNEERIGTLPMYHGLPELYVSDQGAIVDSPRIDILTKKKPMTTLAK